MEKLEKEDERIIQKKIDGLLSVQEEERFNELMKNSLQARNLYRGLLDIHRSLEKDSKYTPQIDFAHEIMQTIKSKHAQQSIFSKTNKLRLSAWLAYAAILLIGLFIGSLVTYLGTSTSVPDTNQISGTIAATQEQNFEYNRDGTDIKIQEFKTSKVKISVISINSEDAVQCLISGNNTGITEKNISLQYADGQFHALETANDKLQYVCSGSVVFQICRNIDTNLSDSLSIQFVKNGQTIKHLNLN